MRAGILRERITFQTKSEASDGMGAGGTETWADTLTNVPAAIWPLKGDRAIDAMKLEHKITHKIRVRYQSTILSTMRIKWGSRYMSIESLINIDERNREMEIFAEELKS